MSELDVIIRIRAEQAAEYGALFADASCRASASTRHERVSQRPDPRSFGTDDRQDDRHAIAVEVPSHAAHTGHDADPGFQEFNRLAELLQPEDPLMPRRRGAARSLRCRELRYPMDGTGDQDASAERPALRIERVHPPVGTCAR
jgi:hypothetical protein